MNDGRLRAAVLFGEPLMRERFSSRRQAVGGEGRLVDSLLFTRNPPLRPVDCTPVVRHETRNRLHWQQLAAAARRPQAVAGLLRTWPAADRPGPSGGGDDCRRPR